jgi:hypothetical protein
MHGLDMDEEDGEVGGGPPRRRWAPAHLTVGFEVSGLGCHQQACDALHSMLCQLRPLNRSRASSSDAVVHAALAAA